MRSNSLDTSWEDKELSETLYKSRYKEKKEEESHVWCLTISKPMSHMKRSIIEQWRDNVGETGCLVPAFKQNTNDNDDDTMSIKRRICKFLKCY